jgi:hypothetical protein
MVADSTMNDFVKEAARQSIDCMGRKIIDTITST